MQSVIYFILLILNLMLPVGKIMAGSMGYTFDFSNYQLMEGIIAATATFGVISLHFKGNQPEKCSRWLEVLIIANAFLSIVGGVISILLRGIMLVIPTFINMCCCGYAVFKYTRTDATRVALVLLGVMAVFIIYINWIFEEWSSVTVVRTIQSPAGTAYAEIIDCDEGALGGSTDVKVCADYKKTCFPFKIAKKPYSVYTTGWGVADDIEVYWKSEKCIVVEGKSIMIK